MTEPLMEAWIRAHGAVGLVALTLGLLALAAPKRPGAHPWLGRGYLLAVLAAIAVAAPVIVARDNLFLVGMGLLVVAHGATAWAAARFRPNGPVGPLARTAAFGAGAGFLAFGAWGGLALARGHGMGGVVVGMAAIGLVLVRRILRHQGDWRALHVHGAAGALISAVTAFAAAAGPRLLPGLPEPVLWLAPTALLTPLFIRLGRRPGPPR